MTDRRIGFWEASNQPRSIDYPFTVIELRLNRDGEGEGKMSLATKIIADKENNIVTLENYDIQPVMLNNVRREKVAVARGSAFADHGPRRLVVTQRRRTLRGAGCRRASTRRTTPRRRAPASPSERLHFFGA